MGFVGFLNFGLKCIQLLAWPSLALGYPLCASIRAIETNSNYHMRKLGSILASYKDISSVLVSDTQLRGACNAYKSLVRPCLSLYLLEVGINLLNKNQELSLKGETFLAVAERYVNENGTEALEKLIAKKGTLQKFDAEEIKSVAAGEKKEVATLIQPNSKEPIVAQKDIKAVEILEEMQQLQKTVKNVVDTLFSQTEDKTSIAMEVKNMTLPATIGDNALPEYPALEYVQKEWTCAVCQVTTQSEATLNSHLQGAKHKSKCEELKARKQTAKNKNPSSTKSKEILNSHLQGVQHRSKCEELKASEQTGNKKNSSSSTPKSDQANQDPTRGSSGGGPNTQWGCALCQVTLPSEATRKSHCQGSKHRSNCEELKASKMAAKNKNSSSAAYKTDQTNQDQKKNVSAGGLNKNTSKITNVKVKVQADVNTGKHWCSICDLTCNSVIDMASHLKGSRHWSQIQDLADSSSVDYWCNICDVKCYNVIDMASHLNGNKHVSRLEG